VVPDTASQVQRPRYSVPDTAPYQKPKSLTAKEWIIK
jgi:hypothetical protein